MKRVKTKNKANKKFYVSQKQMHKVAKETARNALESAMALVLAATRDTLGLTEEQAKQIKILADRYSDYINVGSIQKDMPIKSLEYDGINLRYVLAEESKDDPEENNELPKL